MSNRHRNLTVLGGLAWLLARSVNRWPLILVAAFFLSSEGPHLRISYTYQGSHAYPRYVTCTYLGSRGFIPALGPICPVLAWFDSRGGE